MQTDGLLHRIQKCLHLNDTEMARLMELRLKEYRSIKGLSVAALTDVDTHPMWAALERYIDTHVGELMAARRELQIKRERDHKRAVARRAMVTRS
jgi:hypothetical protein